MDGNLAVLRHPVVGPQEPRRNAPPGRPGRGHVAQGALGGAFVERLLELGIDRCEQALDLGTGPGDIPILLRDLAHVQIGPEMRRVVADLDGEGEVTGGIIVMLA